MESHNECDDAMMANEKEQVSDVVPEQQVLNGDSSENAELCNTLESNETARTSADAVSHTDHSYCSQEPNPTGPTEDKHVLKNCCGYFKASGVKIDFSSLDEEEDTFEEECRSRKWKVLLSSIDVIEAELCDLKIRKERMVTLQGVKNKPSRLPKRSMKHADQIKQEEDPFPKRFHNTVREIRKGSDVVTVKEITVLDIISDSDDEEVGDLQVSIFLHLSSSILP